MKHGLLSSLGLALSLLITSASAQSYHLLSNASEIVSVIDLATSEVLVATDTLRAEEVAEALREAVVVRGVPVFILVPQLKVEENASYVAGLAHAGANVRLSEIGGSFLIVDRRYTVAGPLIGTLGELNGGAPTILIDDPSYAAQFIEGFRQSFEVAQVYAPIGR